MTGREATRASWIAEIAARLDDNGIATESLGIGKGDMVTVVPMSALGHRKTLETFGINAHGSRGMWRGIRVRVLKSRRCAGGEHNPVAS